MAPGAEIEVQYRGGRRNRLYDGRECAHAGADAFISGTALFSQRSLGAAVKKMKKIVEKAGARHVPIGTEVVAAYKF